MSANSTLIITLMKGYYPFYAIEHLHPGLLPLSDLCTLFLCSRKKQIKEFPRL